MTHRIERIRVETNRAGPHVYVRASCDDCGELAYEERHDGAEVKARHDARAHLERIPCRDD